MKQCDECKNCLLWDHGYSNWTVEGTEVHCMVNAHPKGPFDRWYGTDIRLNFADECSEYIAGDPQSLDVDHEDFKGLSVAAKTYIDNI